MTAIRVEQTIERPARAVFDYLSDFENNPRWQGGMRHASFTSEGPLRVGSTYAQEASFLGRKVETMFEVTALEPGRSITIESRESTFPIRVTRSVGELGAERCLVTALIEGGPEGFLFQLLSPLMDRMAARQIRADYRDLKRILESEPRS